MPAKQPNKVMLIAIRFADNTIGIMSYLLEDRQGNKHGEDTDEGVAAAIAASQFDSSKLPIKGWWNLRTNAKELNAKLEEAHLYRKAWRFNKDTRSIVVDMEAAKEKHLHLIRLRRNKKLKELDVEWSKHIAKQNPRLAENVEIERQRLRDIPQTFDMSEAQDLSQLRQMWPEGLYNPFKGE